MDSSRLPPRDALVRTMDRIYRLRMTTPSGGNLSIRDPDGAIWITPARVDKGRLQPDDIVCVSPDGARTGVHPPSSELPFHREIYRHRPDIGAIVHAHPGALVAFSICRQLPDTRIQAHAHVVCGKISFAAYACPGSEALGRSIAAEFAAGSSCVVLENHGVVIGGRDLREAFQRFETLEYLAQTLLSAVTLGGVRALPETHLRDIAATNYAELATASLSNAETALRQRLCSFVHRGYEQRLIISTAGTLSARLDADSFLITPSRCDRLELEPSGLVRTTAHACEAGKHPSRTAPLHAAIYARDPAIGAVICAQPVHAFAFCVSATMLSTRTIPESYLVLRDVPRLPFACLSREAARIAGHLTLKTCPALLVENVGAVVIGRDLLEAFDRLEVLEATAEALLLSRPLGPMTPLPDVALTDIRAVFGLE